MKLPVVILGAAGFVGLAWLATATGSGPLLGLATGCLVVGWRFGGAAKKQAVPTAEHSGKARRAGLEEILQTRLDALLWHNPQGDQARARLACEECVAQFGSEAFEALLERGHAAALAVKTLAQGLSRMEVLEHLRAYSDAALSATGGQQAGHAAA